MTSPPVDMDLQTKLWLPRLGKTIDRPWFLPDIETLKEQQRILSSTYYLIKQGDAFGERLKCANCQRRHDYITLRCVEQPFTGLARGLYAYYRAIKDNQLESNLRGAVASQFNQVTDVLRRMPDLSKTHPRMARKFVADIGLTDAQLGAVSLGILEGIPEAYAKKLAFRINARGIKPPFRLEQPSAFDVHRSREFNSQSRNR